MDKLSIDDLTKRIQELNSQVDALESELAVRVCTQNVEIVGEDNVKRAWLAVDDDGTVALSLADHNMRARVRISVMAKGIPALAFLDENDETRLVLDLEDFCRPMLLLKGVDGRPDIRLGIDEDGNAGLWISGNGLTEGAKLIVDNAGTPRLVLCDRSGQVVSVE